MTKAKNGQNIVTPTAEGIAVAARNTGQKGLPPVHLWNPDFCGDLDIRIARDGTWFYLGTPIGRKELVRLFSTIIRRDGDDYFLVTPVEKVGITVDDAPFVAVGFDVNKVGNDQILTFTTNVDDQVIAGPNCPIRVIHDAKTNEPSPYVLVRNNLEALIDRKSFYRLVEIGSHHRVNGQDWFGVWSSGTFFPIIASDDLP
jgi:hypothetical protein